MKKVFALMTLALVGASLTFTSCNKKKNWNCKCTTNSTTSTTPITDKSKSDADDVCDGLENQAKALGLSTTCDLSEQ